MIASSDGSLYEDDVAHALSVPIVPDYDMEGFRASGKAKADNGHYPDDYKLPNHMTFSDQSKYHGVDGNEGGHWSQLTDDRWSFTPGATNFQNHSLQEMQDYFKKYEPGNVLNSEAAMDDFEKKGMTSGKIPEIQGGGVNITNSPERRGYSNDNQVNPTPYEEALLQQSWNKLQKQIGDKTMDKFKK